MPYSKNLRTPWKHTRYCLIEKIGAGGTGEVFRAKDRLTGQLVALKRLYKYEPSCSNDLHLRQIHLAHEFEILASFRHPHIVRVFDYGIDNFLQPFLVMELLEEAEQVDKASCLLSWIDRIKLLVQILQTLSYLHRRGFLHRDIKPENILFSVTDVGPYVKLLDFGLATSFLDKSSLECSAGSVGYLAPELQRGEVASTASDLFAVGVLAHELLFGKHPLASRPMFERFLGHWSAAPEFTNDEQINPALCMVLRRALCFDKSQRYSDAMQFAEELASAAGNQSAQEILSHTDSSLPALMANVQGAEMRDFLDSLIQAQFHCNCLSFIGAERKIGQNFNLEELRTVALVRGFRVVHVHLQHTRSNPYALWKDVIRSICLFTHIEESHASILRTFVPDLDVLLDRQVSSGQQISNVSSDQFVLKLRDVCEAVESTLHSQSQPLMILMDNLHCSDTESLDVLHQLLRRGTTFHTSITIIASYQPNEMPHIAQELENYNLTQFSCALYEIPSANCASKSRMSLELFGKLTNVEHINRRENSSINVSSSRIIESI